MVGLSAYADEIILQEMGQFSRNDERGKARNY